MSLPWELSDEDPDAILWEEQTEGQRLIGAVPCEWTAWDHAEQVPWFPCPGCKAQV